MKTSVVLQPSNIEMGEIIKELLSSQDPIYNKVWLVSAFANANAIQRIAPNILEAKARGANINIIVGFDVNSTSAEALKRINSLGVASVLVHNARAGHTFHPKIYLFEAAGKRAEVFVGSNNLTDGGLYTNYEASTRTVFEFPSDNEGYTQFFTSLEPYLNPTGSTSQVLTSGLIEILVKRGDVPTEKEIRKNQAKTLKPKKKAGVPKSPFGVENIKRPPSLKKSIKKSSAAKTRVGTVITPLQISGTQNFGELLWQKTNLPASDVQRQKGNVTGGLRLVQAKWKVSGAFIDQTTYFRNDVFGHLIWSVWKTMPPGEKAETTFEVNLLGKGYGVYHLMISHKPSGEAKQGNYTTMLHWGNLAETIRNLNLIGKTFNLYSPPPNQTEPFIIEVK
ncbi:MAG: phospholipase D family protein [Chloroflexi bacterium]|nr:phospholipase D family protein [Chloroflexota bacterium]